ncbi:hypothetical protein ACL9SH_28060 [Klebsiella pneumoniae]|uniref:hypothetical protein n=1 Tax=Klebsiella pneumoniae TaxID=573 RepID=UPI003EBEA0A4
MMREKSRRPSPLQRRVLIVLAALGAKRPGPVATRDIPEKIVCHPRLPEGVDFDHHNPRRNQYR